MFNLGSTRDLNARARDARWSQLAIVHIARNFLGKSDEDIAPLADTSPQDIEALAKEAATAYKENNAFWHSIVMICQELRIEAHPDDEAPPQDVG